ncbi:MAG: VapE family protein, partial [Bacteroidota bacterium]|nr:VapE family protein [Bacteroidota bacterium]
NIRDCKERDDEDQFKKLKNSLPAFTPSGLFKGDINLNNLVKYSNVIVLDIDKLTKDEVINAKEKAIADPLTFICFISPGGHGLKILVRTDNNMDFHKEAFEELKIYYEKITGCKIDPSGKNVNRLCYFSYDENFYSNDNSLIFKTFTTMLENDIEKITSQIEVNKIDITANYNDWLKIGFALVNGLGEGGRNYFHRISCFYSQYDAKETNDQYDKCLRSKGSGTTYKSFFFLAKQYGIDISPVQTFSDSDYNKFMTENLKETNSLSNSTVSKVITNKIEIIQDFLSKHYDFRFNIVTNQLEFKKKKSNLYEPVNDYYQNSILCDIEKTNIKCNTSKLESILKSDFSPEYNPFTDYFYHLPKWDGKTDYISQLANTVSTSNQKFWVDVFKKWIVVVVASALNPDCVNHFAIIFSGEQGIGKTTWLNNLCPDKLNKYIYSGYINPSSKDSEIHLTECILINLDELENLNRSNIGSLKEMMTKKIIKLRRVYAHNNESYPRRASFMGSTNNIQILNDSTGSRRFLCFDTLSIILNHNINMDLVYSQALCLFNSGYKFYFENTEIETINENNEKFQSFTPEEDLLLEYYEPAKDNDINKKHLSATQILSEITKNNRLSFNAKHSASSLGKALSKYKFPSKIIKGKKVYQVKRKMISVD